MSGVMSRVLLNTSHVDTQVQDRKLVYNFDKKKHAQVLLHNLVAMQDNLSNVIITSKENEQFHFHGPILAALSKKLEDTVERVLGSAASKGSKVVMEENFSSEAVQCLWDYAYTLIVTLTPSNIEEVKELAEHYGLDRLKKECQALEEERSEDDFEPVDLEFKDLSVTVLNRLYGLLEQGRLCSAAIKGSDPLAKIPCHGAILAAASSEFLLGFESENKLQVTDTQFQVITAFLRFLYTAKLTIDPSTVEHLLEAAVSFNVPGVGHACCCWLEEALVVDNCLYIMGLAKDLLTKILNETCPETESKEGVTLSDALKDLYQSARSLVLKNFNDVKDDDEFLEQSPETLLDLIDDDGLVVNEEALFHAVIKWTEFDQETRATYLPRILQSVRLESTDDEFLEAIKEYDLLKTNPLCIEVVENAIQLKRFHESKERGFFPENVYETPAQEEIYQDEFRSPLKDDELLDQYFKSLETITSPGKKPDMRLRENRQALNGRNMDGTPDKRLKENKAKRPDVIKKLTYEDDDAPRRRDGEPDMRFKVNKMRKGKPAVQDANAKQISQEPTTKDGKPDMRFKANRQLREQGGLSTRPSGDDVRGPLKKDGTPDMRYAANKQPSQRTPRTAAPGPLKSDGTPDMRFAANKALKQGSQTSSLTSSGPLKKDGTPDMRYSSNKSSYGSSSSSYTSGSSSYGGAASSISSRSSHSSPSGPLKRDGTPDMRYSCNKASYGSSYGSSSSSYGGSSSYSGSSSSSFTPSGPLKRDGTPDMRYSANRR